MVSGSLLRLLGLLSVGVLGLSACATQVVHQVRAIAVGATPAQVREVVGEPLQRQVQGAREAWQYCATGLLQDTFIVVWFRDSQVTGLRTYPSRPGEVGFFCDSHLPPIAWDDAPDGTPAPDR
jgi:hypothetical protein